MDFATAMNALSWEFYNRFFIVLVDYGIVYLPLLIFLYQNWLSENVLVKDSNKSIVALSVKKMLVSLITFFFMYYLAFVPLIPLSAVNDQKSANPIPAYDSTFNQNIKKAADKFLAHDIVIKVPILWASMEVFINHINQGFLNSLPKTAGDIRGAMATVIKNSSIKTPFVRDQYEHFYNQCYLPAAGKFQTMKDRGDITVNDWWGNDAKLSDYNWVGGKYYLKTEGFYKPCPVGGKCQKDPVYPAGITTEFTGIEVSCDWLWNTNGGLKKNLIKEFKLDSSNSDEWIDNQLRHRLKNKTGIRIQKDQAIKDIEEGSSWFSFNTIATIIKQALAVIGAWITEFFLEITTTAIIAFLPLGQAITLMFFVIILPIIMLVSAIRIDVFIRFLVYYFAISFLTVIWAIIAFIDNNIMNILASNTGEGPGSGVAETASQIVSHLTLTGSLISIATTYLYYQGTTKWLTLMSMAGSQGALEASSAMNEVSSSGKEVGNTVGKKIGK